MADAWQVEQAIADAITAAVYPGGPSTIGAPANIARGWPTESDIRAAVKAGQVLIRCHAILGVSRDATRFQRTWVDLPTPGITLTATTDWPVVSFGGTPAPGQFVGIEFQGLGYTYVVQPGDTLANIAASFAEQIPGTIAAGADLEFPESILPALVFLTHNGPSQIETGRECQMFTVAVWAPSPALRDTTMNLVHGAVAYAYRLTLADGNIATLTDIGTTGPDDVTARAGEWRRDLRLEYDYPLTYVQVLPPVATLPIMRLAGFTPLTAQAYLGTGVTGEVIGTGVDGEVFIV